MGTFPQLRSNCSLWINCGPVICGCIFMYISLFWHSVLFGPILLTNDKFLIKSSFHGISRKKVRGNSKAFSKKKSVGLGLSQLFPTNLRYHSCRYFTSTTVTWGRRRGQVDHSVYIPLDPSRTHCVSLLLICPEQTPFDQHPTLMICSTRPAPRSLTHTHEDRNDDR